MPFWRVALQEERRPGPRQEIPIAGGIDAKEPRLPACENVALGPDADRVVIILQKRQPSQSQGKPHSNPGALGFSKHPPRSGDNDRWAGAPVKVVDEDIPVSGGADSTDVREGMR